MPAQIKFNAIAAGGHILFENDHQVHIPIVIMKEGLIHGSSGYAGAAMRKYESFANDVKNLDGVGILRGHSTVSPNGRIVKRADTIGVIRHPKANAARRNVTATAIFHKSKLTPDEMAEIKSEQPFDASIEFSCNTVRKNGSWNGQRYQYEELGPFKFHGVAKLPRGQGACSVNDGCGFKLNKKYSRSNIMSKEVVKVNSKVTRTIDGGYQVEIDMPDEASLAAEMEAGLQKFNEAYQEQQTIRQNRARSALQKSQEILEQRSTGLAQDRQMREMFRNQAEHLGKPIERWTIEDHVQNSAHHDEIKENAKQNAYGDHPASIVYDSYPDLSGDSDLARSRQIQLDLSRAGIQLTPEQQATLDRYYTNQIEGAKEQLKKTLSRRQ